MERFRFKLAILVIAAATAVPAFAGQSADEQKAEQIAVFLRDSGRMRNYSVGVKYNAGTVWLSGRVASRAQMNAALEVVSEAAGVSKIVNDLKVAPGKTSLKQPRARKTGAARPYARQASAEAQMQQPMPAAPAFGDVMK